MAEVKTANNARFYYRLVLIGYESRQQRPADTTARAYMKHPKRQAALKMRRRALAPCNTATRRYRLLAVDATQ